MVWGQGDCVLGLGSRLWFKRVRARDQDYCLIGLVLSAMARLGLRLGILFNRDRLRVAKFISKIIEWFDI